LTLKVYVKFTRINSVAKMPKDVTNIKHNWFYEIITNYKYILSIRNDIFFV
jgi:hypothetical protein